MTWTGLRHFRNIPAERKGNHLIQKKYIKMKLLGLSFDPCNPCYISRNSIFEVPL